MIRDAHLENGFIKEPIAEERRVQRVFAKDRFGSSGDKKNNFEHLLVVERRVVVYGFRKYYYCLE